MLSWGIDVGSRRMARLMRKGIDLDEAAVILRASHEAGIVNQINLIVGMPHETDADVEETMQWIERVGGWVERILVARCNYYGSSLLGTHPERYGLRHSPDGRGVDVPGGVSWEDHVRVVDARVEAVMRAAWGKAGLLT